MARRTALLLALLLALPVLAGLPGDAERILTASEPVTVNALAVAQTPQGLVGVTAQVQATAVAGGTGQVFLDTKPVAMADMQGSARQAARAAAGAVGADWRTYDYLVVFRSDSPVVGGPSAGAVLAAALAAALWNLENPDETWTLDAGVAATGTINPDGTVGPVGGVPAKAEGARDAGLHTVLYPAGLEQVATGGLGGGRTVHMDDHCSALGITCRSVATVQEVIEAFTGVRIQEPEVPVPATADYEAILLPEVTPEVDRLEARLETAWHNLDDAGLPASAQNAVRQELDEAQDRLASAQNALGQDRFYTAATRAFQGHIHAGSAERLTAFHASGRDDAPVRQAIEECRSAIASAQDSVGALAADDLNALYAVGAAQRRLADAEDLLAEAERSFQQAFTRDQWAQSLFAGSFCVERAATAQWWAGLRGLFGAGPPILDMQALLRDTIEEAQELVVYADAVAGGGAGGAQARLEAAAMHQEAQQPAAAILAAVEAQVQASVAVQAEAGTVSDGVLAAAEERAARAVAQAREAGAEPVLSVSLMELAADTEDAAASLANLWTARSLALLAVATPGPPTAVQTGVPAAAETDALELVLSLAVGGLLGGTAAGAAVAVAWVLGRRDDGADTDGE